MFESLTDKLNGVFKQLSNRGLLTEEDIDTALKEVRRALLEADVNFKVVRDLLARIRERCVDASVLQSLTPTQQIITVVHEEMTKVLGESRKPLASRGHNPDVVMLVGLQGSGKTTTAAKLARYLREQGRAPMLAAADLKRPAAIDQLVSLGKQQDVPVYQEDPKSSTPIKVAENALKQARQQGFGWLLVDTGGRLHIDDELMDELKRVKAAVDPVETLLVVDAMTGQDALRAAQDFHASVGLTGLILTKMDGDARGGAALSITAVTGLPIKFIGVGEKADALEPYYPDRLASRILGMGDIQSLLEKAHQAIDEKKAAEMQRKMQTASFNLEDFLEQMQQVKKMGSLTSIMEMLPGFSAMSKKMPKDALDDRHLARTEAIILSMTREERRNPDMIGGSRRKRIARGSGTTPAEINALLNQFQQTRKLMKQFSSAKGRKGLARMLGGMGGR